MELSVWSVKGSLRETNPAGRAWTLSTDGTGEIRAG